MTDAELRKLKRTDLLEMLLEQSKENEALKEEVEQLKSQLASREIKINEAGTIAQASFELNGVLEAAQAAAQQYLDNLARLEERKEKVCCEMEAETAAKVNRLMSETQNQCEEKERTTADRCAAMEQAVVERCNLMKSETKQWCADKEEETNKKCQEREQEAQNRCEKLSKKAEADVEARWAELSNRLETFYNAHIGLRELIASTGGLQRE